MTWTGFLWILSFLCIPKWAANSGRVVSSVAPVRIWLKRGNRAWWCWRHTPWRKRRRTWSALKIGHPPCILQFSFTAWYYNIINDDIMMIDDDQPSISVTCSAAWTDLRPCAAKLPSKWTANSAALVPPSTWNPGMAQDAGTGVGTHVAFPKQWDSLRFCPTKIESLYDMILDDFGWYCFTHFT